MPIEHEYKYVCSLRMLETWPEDKLHCLCGSYLIEQGSLMYDGPQQVRLRKSTLGDRISWLLSYKHRTGGRTVEINHPLEPTDGDLLWPACTLKLSKRRFTLPDDAGVWEIDYFQQDGRVYFIMAEIELRDGALPPSRLPDVLQQHLIYQVRQGDVRFFNTFLGDVDYATSLYKAIHQENAFQPERQECSDV